MQIQRENRRAIADHNLGSQMIAVSQAMHRLNGEARKIFFPGKTPQGSLIRRCAARDYETQQKSGPQIHFASSFFFGTSTITLIAVNLRSESSLASTVTGVSISMSVALIGSLPL